ncbi:MAG: 23S rRNA (adenine(2503)-C(2))-methyltransferase RlmN [Deltaproteobacteria bacterium]
MQRSALPHASDAWALGPSELGARLNASGAAVFAALQRPWRWRGERPDVSPRIWSELGELGCALPRVAARHASEDGSHKLLLAVPSRGAGEDYLELVHMPRDVRHARVTLCVSSQVGCALGCSFCATAALGLKRHLSAGEIVGQVLVALHLLGPRHPGELTLVFMGMGEPLHNLAQVARAIGILSQPSGLGLAARRISVSTAGLVPQIDELARMCPRPLLAVSLNATTDELRGQLMPINRRYPLAQLRAALERYPCRPRERITIEYVLLAGVNDTLQDAARLADFCATFPCQINLIPFNGHAHAAFRAPSEPELEAFVGAVLERRPSLLSVRRSRGRDIDAACGQLAGALRARPGASEPQFQVSGAG